MDGERSRGEERGPLAFFLMRPVRRPSGEGRSSELLWIVKSGKGLGREVAR